MFRLFKTVVILVVLFIPSIAEAQESWIDSTDKAVLKNTGVSSAFFFATAFTMDEAFRNFALSGKNNLMDKYTHAANYMGSKKVVLPLNALVYAGGLVSGDQDLQQTSFNAFKSVMVSAGVTISMKYLTGRSRPYTNDGAYSFDPFPKDQHAFRALPSGHATLAFAFFTPFAEEYSKWLYAIPFSVGLSRIYKDQHWTSDVVLGSAIGFLTGYFFQTKNRNIEVSLDGIVIKF
ncbi:MAG: phosphatase PAP2 family protein [Bacteroidales bacterium]|nr:phosphatase PAP2 family protein [Bacteroidales bacterium]MBS3774222.1 phosphatase PAP2 family protein [Bacteroidales bacterium]